MSKTSVICNIAELLREDIICIAELDDFSDDLQSKLYCKDRVTRQMI